MKTPVFNALKRFAEENNASFPMPDPVTSLPMYEAYHRPRKQVELDKCIGEIAASSIIPYPPWIPLVVPGEVISQELYESIVFLIENDIEIIGLMGYNKDKVTVIDKGE